MFIIFTIKNKFKLTYFIYNRKRCSNCVLQNFRVNLFNTSRFNFLFSEYFIFILNIEKYLFIFLLILFFPLKYILIPSDFNIY